MMFKKVTLVTVLLFLSCISFTKNSDDRNVLDSIELIDSNFILGDLYLPDKVDGVDIKWSKSSNSDIIKVDGSVFRPSFSQGDKVVTLEASCTVNKKKFVKVFEFTVKAYGKKSEEIRILNNSITMLHIPNGELKKIGSFIDITRDYYISESPVGIELYNSIMNSRISGDTEDIPVTEISWYDANIFCRKLSYYTGIKFRLPTEIEIEYAEEAEVLKDKGFYVWSSDRYSDPVYTGENPSVPACWGDYILVRKGNVRDYQYSLEGRKNLGFRLAFDN